ncbi:MAG TPA: hypothetical protein VLR90_22825 [Blastocatellia bacterium]|nr:hypothetical protein [Blastocatellia bacterium]
MSDSLQMRQALAKAPGKYHHALQLCMALRRASLCSLLIAVIFAQACLIDIQTARASTVSSSRAIESPLFLSVAQNSDPKKTLDRVSILMDEIKAASYPELRGADIQVKFFESRSDYFRARFAVPQFLTGRKMRYIVFVNADVFTRQAPEEGVRAILAHELAHVLYFRQRNRLRLLGLVRLTSKGFTSRFERWADLQAIARGYGEGLKEYRKWLYQNIPAKNMREKKRDYFSPEEIDAIVSSAQRQPELLAYWLEHVPRNLKEIFAGTER